MVGKQRGTCMKLIKVRSVNKIGLGTTKKTLEATKMSFYNCFDKYISMVAVQHTTEDFSGSNQHLSIIKV